MVLACVVDGLQRRVLKLVREIEIVEIVETGKTAKLLAKLRVLA